MASEHDKRALRPTAGGMIVVRIADEIERLKTAPEWKSGDRHAISLVKDDALNVLLMALKKGGRLHEHRTKGPIALQLISGSIQFTGAAEHRRLSAGEMVALDRGVPHSLEALEDSALLLLTSIH